MGLYDDVYAAFEAADVRYVVVGGMAVLMSGHARATVDLDVVVDLDPESALRAMRALQQLGLRPRVPVVPADFADPAIRQDWVRDKHLQVLSFLDPQNVAREVDAFVTYPLDFEQLVQRAVPMPVGDRTVPVAAVEHLIEMKTQAGRPRDLADIEALQRSREREVTAVAGDHWMRGTFAGTEQAQAQIVADLTPDARLALLEQLLDVALASGALERAREMKQQALDKLWTTA